MSGKTQREREREREREDFSFPYLLPGAKGCQRLHPLARSSETSLVGCMSLVRLRFSALCLNLTAWFSSHDLSPVKHLFDLSALIVIVLSCLLIKIWLLAKHTGHKERNESPWYMLYNRPGQFSLIVDVLANWENLLEQSFATMIKCAFIFLTTNILVASTTLWSNSNWKSISSWIRLCDTFTCVTFKSPTHWSNGERLRNYQILPITTRLLPGYQLTQRATFHGLYYLCHVM